MSLVSALAESSFLLINKEKGVSSFYCVKKIRYHLSKICGLKKLKVGHSGTLDPFAEGLLIIAIGKQTKKLNQFINYDKSYQFTFYLGSKSTTYDCEGEIQHQSDRIPDLDEIQKIINEKFQGKILQTVPAYSAVKQKGKRLYELARNGLTIDLPVKEVEIKSIQLTQYEYPLLTGEVLCSKGTYIRSIAHDLGEFLGTGAYCSALTRKQIAHFDLSNAWKLEDLISLLSRI